jgi:hypothetical protein
MGEGDTCIFWSARVKALHSDLNNSQNGRTAWCQLVYRADQVQGIVRW